MFRAIVALFVAFSVLAVVAVVGTTFGLLYRILFDWWLYRWFRNPFHLVVAFYAWFDTYVCLQLIMKVDIETDFSINPIKDDEVVVVISNHPTSMAFPPSFNFITQKITSSVLVVSKIQNAFNPLIGWPMWATKTALFVNRNSAKKTRRSIQKHLAKGNLYHNSILIYPCLSRPSPKKIAADRLKFVSKIPDVGDWLKHTLVPRSGGLLEILSNIDQPIRIINVTIGYEKPDYVFKDLADLYRGKLRIHATEAHDVPRTKEALQSWLNTEWRRKNALIESWRRWRKK